MVSASQDGKLIVWDTYTTNKVRDLHKRSLKIISAARNEKVKKKNPLQELLSFLSLHCFL